MGTGQVCPHHADNQTAIVSQGWCHSCPLKVPAGLIPQMTCSRQQQLHCAQPSRPPLSRGHRRWKTIPACAAADPDSSASAGRAAASARHPSFYRAQPDLNRPAAVLRAQAAAMSPRHAGGAQWHPERGGPPCSQIRRRCSRGQLVAWCSCWGWIPWQGGARQQQMLSTFLQPRRELSMSATAGAVPPRAAAALNLSHRQTYVQGPGAARLWLPHARPGLPPHH
jgi:hypothetical protein